ncbi:hypothetical protein J6590_075724 [Homalodisca vitripennis]|nr:hypothetical protein J6590_075724 [Homalodisca vitripennis]
MVFSGISSSQPESNCPCPRPTALSRARRRSSVAAGTQLTRGANSWAARVARLRRPYGPASDFLGPCRLPDGKHFASPGPRNRATGRRPRGVLPTARRVSAAAPAQATSILSQHGRSCRGLSARSLHPCEYGICVIMPRRRHIQYIRC